MNTIVKTVSRDAAIGKNYLNIAAFVLANVLLPQVFHLAGLGGAVFVPILFFTFFAAVRYGLFCALATALISPLVSNLITAMPAMPVLAVLMAKGVALAFAAHFIIRSVDRASFIRVAAVAVAAQIVGGAFHALFFGGVAAAWSAVAASWPGIVSQVVLVWVICRVARK